MRCQAKRNNGERCKKYAIKTIQGRDYCFDHWVDMAREYSSRPKEGLK